jgi:hypothetical protein
MTVKTNNASILDPARLLKATIYPGKSDLSVLAYGQKRDGIKTTG